jgi:2-polyprenyl-6-methoxyphenol hydroxylase-like FAD-dependent oxidoreductase
MLKRAAIIGGSISGMLAAFRLHGHGWAVEVFERGHDLRDRGAGLMLDPRIAAQVPGIVTRTCGERVVVGRDGRVLWRQPLRKSATAWGELYRCLRARVPAAAIHWQARVVGCTAEGEVRLEDGTSRSFDLIVGADGLDSTARAAVDPAFVPQYFGYIAVRGLVPMEAFPPLAHPLREIVRGGGFLNLYGDRTHATAYAPPGGSLGDDTFNWMWYRNTPERDLPGLFGGAHRWSLPPGEMAAEERAALLEEARACLPESFTAIMAATPSFFLQGIYKGIAASLNRGRIVLVGDAAHIPIPHIGAGATLAWYDVDALIDTLEGDGDLAAWSRARLEASTLDLEVASRLGDALQHQHHDWDSWDASRFDAWWAGIQQGRSLYFDLEPRA